MTMPSVETQNSPDTGCILYLGAGLCSDLQNYLSMHPDNLYLVDPNPQLSQYLGELADINSQVHYMPFALGPKSESVKLHVMSLFDLSAIAQPTGVLERFPNATVTQTPTVQMVSPQRLLSHITLSGSDRNLVVLDIPDLSENLLKMMVSDGFLQRFDTLILTCSRTPLFVGAAAPEAIIPVLLKLGFTINKDSVGEDPEWYVATFDTDRSKQALLQEVAQANKMLTDLRSVQAERETCYQQLESDLHRANAREQALLKDLSELQGKLDNLESELESEKSDSQKAKAELESTTAQLASLRSTLGQVQEERVSLQKEAALSLRLQGLRDADMRDLQARYEALVAQKKEQDTLLRSLLVQLKGASRYLQQIETKDLRDASVAKPLSEPLTKTMLEE